MLCKKREKTTFRTGRVDWIRLVVRRAARIVDMPATSFRAAAPIDDVVKAVALGRIGAVQKWLDGGGKPNTIIDADGGTLLMLSANSGHVRVAELLLKHGAAVDFRDGFGGTALMFAAGLGHAHVLHLLLQHGAVNWRNRQSGFCSLPLTCYNFSYTTRRVALPDGTPIQPNWDLYKKWRALPHKPSPPVVAAVSSLATSALFHPDPRLARSLTTCPPRRAEARTGTARTMRMRTSPYQPWPRGGRRASMRLCPHPMSIDR